MTAIGNASFTANIGDYFHVGTNTPRSFGGEIAEIAVYNAVLSPGQQQAIVSFLETKYNLPEPGSFVLCGLGRRAARHRPPSTPEKLTPFP